ncbi:hypothetical protein L7F22_036903 [Adiantum nelumboides]|nr:hypothetical protein [Adiantum nelumboides]
MSWTGDHPAQCKLGCLKDGGKNGVRRDKPHMKLVTEGVPIPKANCFVNTLPRPTMSTDDDIDRVHENVGYDGVFDVDYNSDQDDGFEDGVNDDGDGFSHTQQEAT